MNPVVKPDVTLSLGLPQVALAVGGDGRGDEDGPEDRGEAMIKLLMLCAMDVSSGNLHRADAYLRQITGLASVSGDPAQRLAAWFAKALAVRLLKRWPGLHKAINHYAWSSELGSSSVPVQPIFTPCFPFLGLAYRIIVNNLLRVISMETVVHFVDLGSGDPKLWVPLIRGLAQSGDRPPHVRLTCVCNRKGILEKLGVMLVKEADISDTPFQFRPLRINLGELTADMLDVRSGESLVVVSMLGLHTLLAEDDRIDAKFSGLCKKDSEVKDCRRLSDFLRIIRSFSPKVFFLVEQEANHNTARLIDRFQEGLYYYSKVFDSISTAFISSHPVPTEEREGLEEMLGQEIEDIISCEGLERKERHERFEKWGVRLTRAGFKISRLFANSIEDAKVETLGRDGYTVVSERLCARICWDGRPIYAVSTWTC
ncbi:hypothetical protein MLD38_033858 [Melastoma candidum]|uniref:Uncharacterized protein n=1 Tax=Melastoma candidum TaxID=119954 RepID=A0ACB9M832_9MYRT|nr:hypothetical protein MLD38_033858 [Melastoma candidum]